MTRTLHFAAALVLGTSCWFAVAQQGATRPVLSARPDPEAASPQTRPSNTNPPVPPSQTATPGMPSATPAAPQGFGIVPADSTVAPPASAAPATTMPLPADATGSPAAPAPLPALASQPAPTSQADPATYKLGLEDGIAVVVWKEPAFSGNLMVRTDGMISLPLLGDVPAAGLTPMALSTEIATRLKKYINDPLVTVTVLAVNSKHLYMLGEILHIGALPFTPDMTPLQAISAAGGLTPYANASHIYILRTEAGKQRKIPFDYKKALKTGNQQGVTLASGDTIVVP